MKGEIFLTARVTFKDVAVKANTEATPGFYEDDEKYSFAYATTDAGLLRILISPADEPEWFVLTEFAPSVWIEVGGHRYTDASNTLKGFLGTAANKRPWHAVAE